MITIESRMTSSPRSRESISSNGAAGHGDYVLLQRPGNISRFLSSWGRHWGREGVDRPSSEDNELDLGWRERLSHFFVDVLSLVQHPLKLLGTCVELPGNLWRARQLVLDKESDKYHSLISQLDPRTELWKEKAGDDTPSSDTATSKTFPGNDAGARRTADVMIMASKLAYENKLIVENVVTNTWLMNFVGFYNCWNEFLKEDNTQVFVFTERAQDAKAIVVAWRGTEPFNAMDWSTDFDFSWYNFKNMGNVHVGFLEALGLADRNDKESLRRLRDKCGAKYSNTMGKGSSASGLHNDVIEDSSKRLAFDKVTKKVKKLLIKHPTAKVYTTGHSLGGALAALFTAMLYYYDETSITEKLAALYTFGQPRVGDAEFANYMKTKLPESIYFRVVYCNDIVPRVPFDNKLFHFKHFGYCTYYNRRYIAQCLEEAPGKNYFYLSDLLTVHVNAAGELYNAFRLAGSEYAESWLSLIARVAALLVPGIGGHSPVNYVNSVRLGPAPLVLELTQEIHTIDKIVHEWEETIRNFVYEIIARCFHKRLHGYKQK